MRNYSTPLVSPWRRVLESNALGKIDRIIWFENEALVVSGNGRRVRTIRYTEGLELWELAPPVIHEPKHSHIIKNHRDSGTIHILSDDLLWSVSSYGEMLWSVELPSKSTLKNLFLLSTSQFVVVISLDSNINQLIFTYHEKVHGTKTSSKSIRWSLDLNETKKSCTTANDIFLCSIKNHLSIYNSPASNSIQSTTDDIVPEQLTFSDSIENYKVIYETNTNILVLVTLINNDKVLYKFFRQQQATSSDNSNWEYIQLEIFTKYPNSVYSVAMEKGNLILIQAYATEQKLNFQKYTVNERSIVLSRTYAVELPELMGDIEYLQYHSNNSPLATLRMNDGSLVVIKFGEHGAELILHRDESLSAIVSAEAFDLSLSIGQMRIEEEFGGTGMLSMFIRRITTQTSQLISFVLKIVDFIIHRHKNQDFMEKQAALVRDEFNLNKILVVVTSVGKVFGILTQSGNILWKQFYNDFTPFDNFNQPSVPLFNIRTAAHYTHQPLASIYSQNTQIKTFNPYTGDNVANLCTTLPYQIRRVFVSSQIDEEFKKVLLLIDKKNKVHTFPSVPLIRALGTTTPTYIYLFDKTEQAFNGYHLTVNDNEQTSTDLQEVWRVVFKNEDVVNIHTRLSTDRVHSNGIVLGDRSVLYKYVNPNLIAVVTEGVDYQKVPFVNLYLVDTVTGSIKLARTHKKVKPPVHVILAENWLLYTYYNQRYRRYEAVSAALFEGYTQYNFSSFSSFDPIVPMTETKAYILPYGVTAIQVTTTEKGITAKDIIMATPNGMLIEIPWMFIDPRRPLDMTQMDREEGLIMYTPELMINYEYVINYYQFVYNIRSIHTMATGLESTSAVFAYGLDLFYTRVFPSRLFDQLKDDFDFMFIGWATIAFVVGSYFARRFASNYTTKKAWK
ncbi:unnamed protein product [Didymodactylos carnosus]|uniref:ER membrane protein complex subunit 1 n=1 Tax=Didymodactylos carnosus TaxID=1234261 RepID=A0A813XLD4_9BILA|nr:unnamed protein product [Didymodactylos carnosus]CAF0877916.1 unnamed protein product [Didymodactylos carnosus]CAF3515801.1 unnamed protein product [Didymodactylos carnosus]CAF3664527.1 unnamed protein product [Didymodactylos carnosus]